jgi:hypothetical protein
MLERNPFSSTNVKEEQERGLNMQRYENRSEIARLLAKISEEYEAAQRGLHGIAYGRARHDFINARMENMGEIHVQLQAIVGDQAISMIADQLNKHQS